MNDINDIQKIFADRLKELITENEFKNASAFALKIDIPAKTIFNWLSCIRTPQIDSLVKLSLFFGVSVDFLLGLKEM